MNARHGKGATRFYFVDEAGDGIIFDRRGKVVIGTPGCSRFFLLGLLDVPDPLVLGTGLKELRTRLLADPFFSGVPSMQPEAKKTAPAFHAKDDVPEVRWEVFRVLKEHAGLRFFAVVTDKRRALDYVRQRQAREPSYRYHPNEIYSYLVRRLFRDRLHKDASYDVCFSKRGKSDRTAALQAELEGARRNLQNRWGIVSNAPIRISAGSPVRSPGLQAADYFLWSVQRLYERGEDRYVRYLCHAFRLVHDIDDTRRARYGEYYTKDRPLTLEVLKGRL